MTGRLDLSIGQRLSIGFLLLLIGLSGLLAAMLHWNEQSADAELAYTRRIAPLNDAAAELDHAVMRITLALRASLAAPTAERLFAYEQRVQEAREALRRLGQLSIDPDSVAHFQPLAALLEDDLRASEEFLRSGDAGPRAVVERYLAARAQSADALYAFSRLHRDKATRALQTMREARRNGTRGLLIAAILSALLFGLTASLMASSIRGPTQELLKIAEALQEGDWKPALAFAPGVGDEAQRDEMRKLARAFGAAAVKLEAREQRLLAQAQSLAENDRIKSEFIGVLAHELRNPLSAISNSMHAMVKVEGNAQAQDIIKRQTRLLARMIDDLLDLTRLSSGKVQLQLEVFELTSLVRDCVEDYQRAAEKAGTALVVETSGFVHVEADRTRVSQVIGNLLDNALKFSGGAREVRVTLRENGNQVEVEVKDEGEGIELNMLGRLFQPFSQADNSLARRRSGLGLGLSLSRALIELHHGSIEARSEGLGKGATFIVRLPLADRAAVQRPAPQLAAAALPKQKQKRRVLIIEDIPDAALSLREAMQLAGHEVRIAYDGVEGLELAREFRPEVLLCDLGLPTIDGYQVAGRFRSDEQLRSTFLIAVSGYAGPGDRQRALQAGFDRHVAKPADLELLQQVVAGLQADPASS